MTRKPEFYLLGGPKCGTTALASYLADHTMIQVSDSKEPNYFCKDLKATGRPPVSSDEEYLNTYFVGLQESDALVSFDASIWYLYSKIAVEEILAFYPSAKFLVMIRNPVDMVWSWYSQLTFQGQEDAMTFMDAWHLQEARKAKREIPSGLWLDQRMLLYKEVCSLGQQLERVYNTVPCELVHVVLSEDLRKDTLNTYKRILEFMDVPYNGRVEFSTKNAGRKVRSTMVYRLLRSKVSLSLVESIKRFTGMKTLEFGRPDMPMPVTTRRFLINEFTEDISLLEKLLGKDLAHWREVE